MSEITEFVPQVATDDDWKLVHEFRRVKHAESRPDDPLTPDDLVEAQMKRENPFVYSRHFGIVQDGKLIATFGAGAMKPEAPDYEENKHILFGGIEVHPEHRRQGHATRLLPTILQLMDEYGATVFTTGAELDPGHAFLRWLGAEEKMVGAENRLAFKEIDWDLVDAWVKEGVDRNPDTKLELFENRLPDSFLEEYCPIYTEVGNQQPFDDLDIGDFKTTPETFKEQYARFDEMGGQHHTYITREPDGAISGLTEIFWFPHKAKYLTQNLTGVVDRHRGRGLGKWLKAEMLAYARDKYDDLEWVVTGNANSNDAMLSINKRLGFREYKGGSTYQIGKDDLAAKVRS